MADYILEYQPKYSSVYFFVHSSQYWTFCLMPHKWQGFSTPAGVNKNYSWYFVISSYSFLLSFWMGLSLALGSFLMHRATDPVDLQSCFSVQLSPYLFCPANWRHLGLSELPALLLNLGEAPGPTRGTLPLPLPYHSLEEAQAVSKQGAVIGLTLFASSLSGINHCPSLCDTQCPEQHCCI